ncbi:hypothetical protein BDV97DRAFT_352378 [Delphinella strobiligena]|nr:hypothetical protein BDV97DRAFT_352378 [Delphinella strobiligena]
MDTSLETVATNKAKSTPSEKVVARSRRYYDARRRRKNTLLKKAYELGKLHDAHIYVLVRYGGRYYCYTSLSYVSWPPPHKQVLESYPLPDLRRPVDFEGSPGTSDNPAMRPYQNPQNRGSE